MSTSSVLRVILMGCASFALVACRSEPAPEPVKAETKTEAPGEKTAAKATSAKLTLGAPIADGAGQKAVLSEVAKAPAGFLDKKLVTEGTITAVCQHMGCWMEIRDASGEAHVKMAGHAFFVPKDASGKKARVLGKLAAAPAGASCGEDDGKPGHEKGAGCKAEAEKQLGRPLAKLELVAEGVEILD